jgi:DNA segregation ATPase FtsK/SpoIIIE, S-DNA-T family
MPAPQLLDTDEGALPAGLRAFLRKRGYESIGVSVLLLIALLVTALATWSAEDPSLHTKTRRAAENLLGLPGAVVSDQLHYVFGLAVLVFLAAPIAWAASLLSHRPVASFRYATLFWIVSTLSCATALGTLPVPPTWPLSVGLGGNLGNILSSALESLGSFALKGVFAPVVVFALSAPLFAWSLIRALGLSEIDPGSRLVRMANTAGSGVLHTFQLGKWLLARRPRFTLSKRQSDDDDQEANDIIRRLAPQRSSSQAAIRIEPMLDGTRARRDASLVTAPPRVPAPVADEVDTDEEEAEDEEETPVARRKPTAASKKNRPSTDDFELPDLDLLAEPKRAGKTVDVSPEYLEENARALEGVLDDFGVKGQILNVKPGPVVTLYELEPAPGIKSSRVISLADDIARSMSAVSARVAVVPGRNAIGIELPNVKRETVFLRELLDSENFNNPKMSLTFALGKNIGGEPIFADLARMPHLLIAGTTGSGKSVGINTMILSLLYRLPPDRCKLIMIDPKMLELSVYEGIPHLLAPVVTDPRKAVVALKWAVREMEDRYKKMSKVGVRNVDGYNTRIQQLIEKGQKLTRTVQTGFDNETGKPIFEQEEMETAPMPFIVVIIDEMADLMMVAGKDIEGAVQRLAQMARAAGIHVVMATQRPSVDVITGTIKANFPTRVSFQVTSKIDSRTILGEQGAEQLLGQGDMLYMAGGGRISRLHGAFVSDGEVEAIVNHLKAQGQPEYVEAVTEEPDEMDFSEAGSGEGGAGSGDSLYDQAVAVVLRDKKVSTSYIQRRLQIGYNKAASLIERMEQEGLISASNATGKREILVPGDSARD